MTKYNNVLSLFKANTCPKPSEGCKPHNLHFAGRPQVETLTVNHLKPIFNDENPHACFNNAIVKKVFTEKQVLHLDNYIMYMRSDNNFDYFKSKLTKTKYQVKRSNV